MLDSNALADLIAELVGDHVERSLAPLLAVNEALAKANEGLVARIAALEERPVTPEPIAPDMEAIGETITRCVAEAVAAVPPVEPLAPDMNAINDAIADKVKAAMAVIPPVEPLAPDMEEIQRSVAVMIDQRFRELPPPAKGDKGNDGVGLAGAVIDRDGALVITLSDGKAVNLGPVVGKDGDHGIPFGPDDLDMTLLEDGRTLRMAFSKGETEYAFQVALPIPVYRGVWREGDAYAEGDMVTWAGSTWHCGAEAATTKPGDPAGEWILAVKAGRPGRDKN